MNKVLITVEFVKEIRETVTYELDEEEISFDYGTDIQSRFTDKAIINDIERGEWFEYGISKGSSDMGITEAKLISVEDKKDA